LKILFLSQIPQNNPDFENYTYHTGNYPYQLTNLIMLHEIQMSNSCMQSNYQGHETSLFCTQDGLETINLGDEIGSTPIVNTPKTRFQPKEDEFIIQSWLNILKDPIVGVDQKGEFFWKRIGKAYKKYRDKNYIERKLMTLKGL
jgi:hypothetical protein